MLSQEIQAQKVEEAGLEQIGRLKYKCRSCGQILTGYINSITVHKGSKRCKEQSKKYSVLLAHTTGRTPVDTV
jgi:hypothetical protein